jgi:bifunctional non-homologous end joining protein LigD
MDNGSCLSVLATGYRCGMTVASHTNEYPVQDSAGDRRSGHSPVRLTAVPDRSALPYPADRISSQDVLDYYRAVADVMLPHLHGRPVTVRGFSDGSGRLGPFQREVSERHPCWLPVVKVPLPDDRGFIRQVVCEDAAALCYLASQGAVEFYVTLSTIESLRCPDRLVIDVEPTEGGDLPELRKAARQVRDLYRLLGLTPYVQATGGRGLHVVAPLDGHSSYQLGTQLAGDIARYLTEAAPDLLIGEHDRAPAAGRVRLGTNRNAYGQTTIAPYSLRGRPGAPVATPLDWSELGRVEPAQHGLRNVRRRLGRKPDPMAGMDAYAMPAATVRKELDRLTGLG